MKHYSEFHDLHKGHPIVICGNGPSLRHVPPRLIADNFSMGSNSIYLSGWVVQYYCIEGINHLLKESERQARMPYMEKVAFYGGANFVNRRMIHEFAHIPHTYSIDYLGPKGKVKRDFSMEPLVQHGTGASVTAFMLQLAFYLGGDPVLLVGVDHRFDGDRWHFFDEDKNAPFDAMTPQRYPQWAPRAEAFYRHAADIYKAHDRILLNLTPNTGTAAFERDELENWL